MRAFLFVRSLAVCGLAACALASSSPPQDSVQQIVRTVESRYHSLHTLKTAFLERYTEGRNTVRVESGTAYFSQSGRMRWEYESPEVKLFLTDGKTAWFYVPADQTVTRAPMKESDDWRTPLALLTGKSNLGRFCKKLELMDKAPGTPGDVTLRCWPAGAKAGDPTGKPGQAQGDSSQAMPTGQSGEIQEILLEVNPKEGWLASVLIRQSGGVELEYRFGKWESDSDLPESMFRFAPPKGVAIVDESTSGHLPQ